MVGPIQGQSQTTLFPESLDEYVTKENPGSFVDALIETLDLEGTGSTQVSPETMVRPPYDPGDLARLYRYGNLNRPRSNRALERESHRNLERTWRMGKLTPDFK